MGSVLSKLSKSDDKQAKNFKKKKVNEWEESDVFDCYEELGFMSLKKKNKERIVVEDLVITKGMERKFWACNEYIRECKEKGTFFDMGLINVGCKISKCRWGFHDNDSFYQMCKSLSDWKNIQNQYLLKDGYRTYCKEGTMKSKLIITSLKEPSKEKSFLRKISPLFSFLPQYPKCGFYHSAILLGPYYLQFNSSGLIVPKDRIESPKANVGIDLKPINLDVDDGLDLKPINLDVDGFDNVIKKIAMVIEQFNTEWTYNQFASLKKKRGNCQTFVERIFHVIYGCDLYESLCPLTWSPFFKYIRTNRSLYQFIFKPAISFVKEYCLSKYSELEKFRHGKIYIIIFDSHQMLDIMCHKLLINCKNEDIRKKLRNTEEFKLLKGLDRAYWLRYSYELKFTERIFSNNRPANAECETKEYVRCENTGCTGCPECTYPSRCGCPFYDAIETPGGSYRIDFSRSGIEKELLFEPPTFEREILSSRHSQIFYQYLIRSIIFNEIRNINMGHHAKPKNK